MNVYDINMTCIMLDSCSAYVQWMLSHYENPEFHWDDFNVSDIVWC